MAQPGAVSPKFRKWDWLWIALIGLVVQGWWASRLPHSTYMDGYYYATNGKRLADGFGFTEEIIWQFLDEPERLPTPSHTYWMPLPSILAAAGYRVSSLFWGAQLPFWILAGLLPWLSMAIGSLLALERWQLWTAALFTLSGGFYLNFFGQPSTFAPFAWAGGLCLLAMAQASSPGSRSRWWLLVGLSAGLGHLTRADGLLLLATAFLIWALRQYEQIRQQHGLPLSSRYSPMVSFGYLTVGYFLVMGGWFIHNEVLFGRPLSTAGTQTIFLTTYDDLFAFGRSFDLMHYLSWGGVNILRSKLQGLSIAAQSFLAVNGLIFLAPLVLWAWYRLKQRQASWLWLRPMTWYGILLLVTMSLVFTLPGGRGGLFHSSASLWPWSMVLAACGIDFAVEWVAARRLGWRPERAKRIFAGLFVGVAFIMSFALGLLRTSPTNEAVFYREIEAMLPSDAVVMVGNAPGFYYHTGLSAISVPNEPIDVLLRAAEKYQVAYLILDDNRPQPLADLYEGLVTHPRVEKLRTFSDGRLYLLHATDREQ